MDNIDYERCIDYVDMDIDKEIINGLSVVEGMKMMDDKLKRINRMNMNNSIEEIRKEMKKVEKGSKDYRYYWNMLNLKYNSGEE